MKGKHRRFLVNEVWKSYTSFGKFCKILWIYIKKLLNHLLSLLFKLI